MAQVITAEQAAALVPSEATLAASGMLVMWAGEIGAALGQRFAKRASRAT